MRRVGGAEVEAVGLPVSSPVAQTKRNLDELQQEKLYFMDAQPAPDLVQSGTST